MTNPDVKRAFKALDSKKAGYTAYFDYYDGDQPVLYTANRLQQIFKGIDAVFTENWCAVVVDATKARINLSSITVPPSVADLWQDIWDGSELQLESDDAHESCLVTGESFIVAWPDDDGVPQAYYNDPRLCHVFYSQANPRVKEFAAKWYAEPSGAVKLTLYYPDKLEYYIANRAPSTYSSFEPDPEEPEALNPYGEIPVFHLRLAKRTVKSDLKSVIPIQNGINKLLADMMVAAEYGAFKQRYVISNSDTAGKLKNAPNEIWHVPAGDGMGQQSQIGQLEPTDLSNYLGAIDNLSLAVSSITQTPKHFFFNQGGNVSGEALIAMEAPLNRKALDRIERFTPVWRDLTRFLLKIAGHTVGEFEIDPIFDQPATVQPLTSAQILQTYRSAGLPLITSARWAGRTAQEIEDLKADLIAEKRDQNAALAKALLDAQRSFNQPVEDDSTPDDKQPAPSDNQSLTQSDKENENV